ncbi:MAG: phenylalanine--tRNA ligase subunit beta [Alphaproteobacteria bacterium]|nr:phenylalanine--tRNA ligase subunit beta [Alphaproteobacteria bacterium]
MKVPLSWLKDHLETTASLTDISEQLTNIGLEVEEINDPLQHFAPFKVVLIEKSDPHPNADRLRICHLDTGDEKISVVCGAPNARAGLKAVFAPTGTTIPGTGAKLKGTVIRGIPSNGMLLSENEMGLSAKAGCLMEFPKTTEVGLPFARAAGLDDPIITIAVPANRGDCFGIHGIARELAATGIGKLKNKKITPLKGKMLTPVKVKISTGMPPHLCPVFALRLVTGIKNDPSPAWLRKRLQAIGLRPVNSVVDVTNFMTFDQNRPLHVFDAHKIKGNLTIRLAEKGEKIKALNKKDYTLEPDMIAIADEEGIISIAGIIGSERTGCDEATKELLIESALWDPLHIARTGRRLAIQSDARHRFERGLDPAFVIPGMEMATQMILDLSGGQNDEMLISGTVPKNEKIIHFMPETLKKMSGIHIRDTEIKVSLQRLGFCISGFGGNAGFRVAIPSWRGDIYEQADLVEEVLRITGVNKILPVPMTRPSLIERPALLPAVSHRHVARRIIASRGMAEAMTWAFISAKHATCFGGGQREVEISNPVSTAMSHMRPSLLPGLILATQRNADRGKQDFALFEIGATYHGNTDREQISTAAGIRRGISHLNGQGRHWSEKTAPTNVLDAKADAMAVLTAMKIDRNAIQVTYPAPEWFHPGRSGTLRLGPRIILAHFGEFHPEIYQHLNVEGNLAGFEIFLDAIPPPRSGTRTAKSPLVPCDLQPVRRDFAFIIDGNVKAVDLIHAAKQADKELIVDVTLFDFFTGGQLSKGKKSLAIEVLLQPKKKTMTEEEIDSISRKIVSQVRDATGGILRDEETRKEK